MWGIVLKYQSQSSSRRASIVAVVAVLSFCVLTVLAQSGRRVKKAAAPPVPTPEASPTPTPKKTPERPAIPVFIGANTFDSYGSIPYYFAESVAKSCAEGMQQRGAIHVELSSRDITRSDAVKRAKEAKEGYVVLLELRSDRMRTSGQDSEVSRIYIEYVAFAAVTGRPVVSGSVYQQASSVRDVILGRSDSTTVAEQRLKNAARVAAQRILGAIAGREP
jgi:hypothetical protein